MKQSIAATGAFLVIFLSSSFLSAESPVESAQPCLSSFFTNSLHFQKLIEKASPEDARRETK